MYGNAAPEGAKCILIRHVIADKDRHSAPLTSNALNNHARGYSLVVFDMRKNIEDELARNNAESRATSCSSEAMNFTYYSLFLR